MGDVATDPLMTKALAALDEVDGPMSVEVIHRLATGEVPEPMTIAKVATCSIFRRTPCVISNGPDLSTSTVTGAVTAATLPKLFAACGRPEGDVAVGDQH